MRVSQASLAADARRATALKALEAQRAKAAAGQGAAGTAEVAAASGEVAAADANVAAVRKELEQLRQQEQQAASAALKAAAQQSKAEQQLLREQLATAQQGAGGADRLGLQLGLVGLTGAAAVELALKRRPPPPLVTAAPHRPARLTSLRLP